ncbi:SPOR domain-containing protein [Methylocapsa aurea]|uniref:SPOR domain-containing protein n=1 Tax=Methylocapsa aurea TaxID=663610 RepID=UPI000569CCDC|nr:SPOR domain-containing protein [Methylocapsa aurea]
MREPVAKRRSMIDFEEFERRLRPANSASRTEGDPLAELARLGGGREDPYKSVFEPRGQGSANAWDQGESSLADPSRGVSSDFAAIEAGLLGARQRDATTQPVDMDDAATFLAIDDGSEHWRYEDEHAPSQPIDNFGEEIRSRRPLYLMAAIIVVGVAGIGASFAFKSGGSSVREVATIKAAEGPTKIQPESTATADVPAQDASILNRTPQAAPAALVNNAEQPVDLSHVQEKAPRVIALGGSRPRSDHAGVSGAASVPVPPPEPAQPQAQAHGEALSIAGLIEPRKVKTISVRPDGTLLPNDRPPPIQAQAAPPSQHPTADAAKASTPKTTARVATTPKAPASGAEGGQPAQAANTAKAKPVQVADAAAGAMPAKASSAAAGTFAVQLAAPTSEQEARDIQVRLMKKHSELAGFHPSIRKAASGDKTVYRVRVGNLSHEEANALCQKIQSGGGNCFVAKN